MRRLVGKREVKVTLGIDERGKGNRVSDGQDPLWPLARSAGRGILTGRSRKVVGTTVIL